MESIIEPRNFHHKLLAFFMNDNLGHHVCRSFSLKDRVVIIDFKKIKYR